MIVSRTSDEAIEAAHEISSHYGVDACGHKADVKDPAQVQKPGQWLRLVRWRRVDILVNNAESIFAPDR